MNNPSRTYPRAVSHTAVALLAAILCAGCSTTLPGLPEAGPRHTPGNVYRAVQRLPAELRRVVVLPPTAAPGDAATTDTLLSLAKILEEELRKTGRFEVVNATPAELKRGFGREAFSASETLPPELLSRLKAAHTADAVLFVRVSAYRAYPPVAVGWDIRLATASTGQTLWSVDETFDAAQPEVARSARDYFRAHHTGASELADPQADLRSPIRFARYAAAAAVGTLPPR